MKTLLTIAGVDVRDNEDGSYSWTAGLMVDADGSPRAYHPISANGLDSLASAGKPGNWWALVTDNGRPTGSPLIQKTTDPAPGFYISTTTLQHPEFPASNPRRYIDAEKVPFVVIPPQVRHQTKGVAMGCRAVVSYRNKTVEAVVADIGPKTKIGEGSVALAKALGIPFNPRNGGTETHEITYTIFPGRPAKCGTFNLVPA